MLIIASVVCFNRHVRRSSARKFADFHCYYVTGQRVLAHENIYISRDNKIAEFRYSPFFAVIMSRFALLDEKNANIIWYLLNFSLLMISFILLKKIVFPQKFAFGKIVLLYFLTYVATVRLIFNNLDTGQANILMMSAIIIGLYLIIKKKEFLGAAFIAFSIMIKYTPIIFIFYFLFKKKFKLSLFILFFVLLYILLPSVILSFKTNIDYLKNMSYYLTHSTILDEMTLYDYDNQSLVSLFYRFFTPFRFYENAPRMFLNLADLSVKNIQLITSLIMLSIFTAIVLPFRKKTNNNFYQHIDYSLLFICLILLNLNAWIHNYIFLTMSFFLIIGYLILTNFKDRVTLILIIIAHFLNLLTTKELFGKNLAYIAHFYSPHIFSALIIIFILLRLKFSKKECF